MFRMWLWWRGPSRMAVAMTAAKAGVRYPISSNAFWRRRYLEPVKPHRNVRQEGERAMRNARPSSVHHSCR